MGWRFRQRFKLIPGVRLNLSKSGLSVSLGGAPFTLNVGPRGLYGTASVPGTGISFREHLSNSTAATRHQQSLGYQPIARDLPLVPVEGPGPIPVPMPTVPGPVATTPVEEVRSASTERLTSASLKDLKDLIQTAYAEREDIENQLREARREGTDASARCFLGEGLLPKATVEEFVCKAESRFRDSLRENCGA